MNVGANLLNALGALRRARENYDAARAESERRSRRALDWLREDPRRTLGDAWAYVGTRSAYDDEEAAKAAFLAAADSVVAAAEIELTRQN